MIQNGLAQIRGVSVAYTDTQLLLCLQRHATVQRCVESSG